MDRKELRKIMNKIKKELSKGKKWEKIICEGVVYCGDNDSLIINKRYTGTVKKEELMDSYFENVKEYFIDNKEYIYIFYDREEKNIYANVLITVEEKNGFIEDGYIDICKMSI